MGVYHVSLCDTVVLRTRNTTILVVVGWVGLRPIGNNLTYVPSLNHPYLFFFSYFFSLSPIQRPLKLVLVDVEMR